MKNIFLFVVLVGVLTACGTSGESGGSINLAGTWSGTVSDGYFGNGTWDATLTHSGTSVSGDYTVTYPGIGTSTGLISGSVSGSSMTITIEVAGCTANGTASVSSTHISGSFTYASGCAAEGFTGTFSGDKN